MGNNCLKISRAGNEEQYYGIVKEVEAIRRMRTLTESRSETKKNGEEEEVVRSERVGGVVRIKVVVSQEELKQILSCEDKDLKYSSVEKILESAMKLRGTTTTTTTRISRVRASGGDFTTSNWRPALESIPEEH